MIVYFKIYLKQEFYHKDSPRQEGFKKTTLQFEGVDNNFIISDLVIKKWH